ncbi:MAG: TerC/Alx family metal homeostasis membrane protein [Clostridiales bacterium]|nr:TerC/Alx family metal homeostasis membrane protein [Clostridiales bacterium]
MDSSIKKALKWVLFWMSMAFLFNAGVFFVEGPDKAQEFLGGYLIELSLSMDNVFVFITIFTAFGVPLAGQHRALNYGIIGAIVFRFIFIFAGVSVVNAFHWVLYVFGGVLIISGLLMYRKHEENKDLGNHLMLRGLRKVVPVTDHFVGNQFFTKIDGRRFATPLFAVVLIIEASDILFAIDSVPAVFSISTDLFIVYSSNIFAILGIRQLYFVLEHLHERFRYVRYGVATILTFTGLKLALIDIVPISIPLSIAFIVAALTASIVLSVLISKRRPPRQENAAQEQGEEESYPPQNLVSRPLPEEGE